MSHRKVQFADIRYNPEISGFEARATLHENGVGYVYPVHVCAALTAEFDYIASKLAMRARKLHENRRTSLHMTINASAQTAAPAYPWAA